MIVLAIDSTAVCATAAACIFENDKLVTYALTTSKNGLTHSETLLPIADGVMRLLGKRMDEVGLFAVSAGPGSFTGVRIGVSLVKGFAFANHTPCAAVSPLEALAKAHEAFPGVVCAVMDARRGQYYNALFQDGERLCSDRAVGTETLCAELADGPVLICGDGAELFCERAAMPNLRLAPACAREQNALSVALCGHRLMTLGQAVTPDKLSPVYLRKPQPEREREERLSKGDSAK
ncbi:MAG TPA: tRNA (adenosine(37)-N6)-threonylcarbamoyltransferase complex dimerization subunit type 1 TsaB [Firmicutes bacterium]|nr:tRNA (adenosine(37)-N6)-threonylcarbamoyltransferase complex dimerization subunit type 1 TsaB [Bacillota bacterium]